MTALTEYRLGDFCSMKYGKMPPKDVLSEDGYPVFSGYRVTGYAKEYLYDEPHVIVVARGVGGTGDVKMSPEKSWVTNLSIVLELDRTVADKRFIYYRLGQEPLRERLNTGAAQAQITIDSLKSHPLALPGIEAQCRIVEILTAYDDLIENNLRRIKLLEESARLLYREWFLHLRFPGHEHVKIVDGVPEGWKAGVVSDFYDTASGGTPSRRQPDFYTGDILWVKTQELENGFIVDTGEKITEEAIQKSSAKLFPANTVLVAMYGATIGQLGILAYPATSNQACCALMPKLDNAGSAYCYFFFRENKDGLISLSMGAAQRNVSQQIIRAFPMIMPADVLVSAFTETAEPALDEIRCLTEQNQALRKARDILLPRLMNGTIAV